MEREVGGGIGMGNIITPWLIHVNVWQKALQYCKVISLQLIKINEKKIQIFVPHNKPAKSETGVAPSSLNKSSRGFLHILKFEDCWFRGCYSY